MIVKCRKINRSDFPSIAILDMRNTCPEFGGVEMGIVSLGVCNTKDEFREKLSEFIRNEKGARYNQITVEFASLDKPSYVTNVLWWDD